MDEIGLSRPFSRDNPIEFSSGLCDIGSGQGWLDDSILTATDVLRGHFAVLREDPRLGPTAREAAALFEASLLEAEIEGRRRLVHDLANRLGGPLSEIRGYAELLAEEPDRRDAASQEMLDHIVAASLRAIAVIQALPHNE